MFFESDFEEMFESDQEVCFQCHLCGANRISRSQLYAHYSTSHYKEELMSLIDRENLQCQICGWKRNKMQLLIPHVGSVHDKVEDYLPAQFHLPRSKPVSHSHQHSLLQSSQTSFEQPLEQSEDTGTNVNNSHMEEEIPRTMNPDPDYLKLHNSLSQNKETESNEKYVQTLMDEEEEIKVLDDIRRIFDDSDDDYN